MNRIFSLILCFSLLSGCKPNNEPITQKEFCLDTIVSITLYDSSSKKILNKCFAPEPAKGHRAFYERPAW